MKVLITRPYPEGENLVSQLNKLGIRTYYTPLVEFSAGADLEQLPLLLSRLTAGDLIIALSPRVFSFIKSRFTTPPLSWPVTVTYLAIGKTTAKLLGTMSQRTVSYPQSREISENLLQLPQLKRVKGKKILLLRGNQGRQLLAQELTSRQAHVVRCECYCRHPVEYNGTIQAANWRQFGIDTIVITSSEMLQRLYHLVPKNQRHWLLNRRLVVISERTAQLAQQFGWINIVIASNANNTALIRTLQSL